MVVGPSEGLYVFVEQQVSVFDSTRRFVRTFSLAQGARQSVVLSNGNVAGLNRFPPRPTTQPDPSRPLETFAEPLFHVFGANGALLRSVDTVLSTADDLIAPGAAGTVWTGKLAPYQLKQWAQDGRLLRTINRVTPFFDTRPYEFASGWFTARGPQPILADVYQDPRGFLWVGVVIPKPNWKETTKAGQYFCCESLVEVLDPMTGALIASARIPLMPHRIMDDGYLAAVTTGPDDEPLLVLYRARLNIPGR
jgi:hypothetical protein